MPRGGFAGLAAGLLLLAGCGAQQSPPSPALWEATGPGGEHLYLFGTVHSLPAGVEWRTPVLDQAFAASDELLVEVDLAARRGDIPAIFARLSRSPGLPPLSHRLPRSDGAALAKAMAGKGLDDGDFAGMESWAAAITLSQAYEANDGEGADLALLKAAKGKRIVELEGAEKQLRAFDALPEADQRDLLAAVAKEALEGERAGDARLENWRRGDVTALVREAHKGLLADPQLREALLVSRNREWAERITGELKRGDTLFVAVGAAHTVGPEGLAALLGARGFKVKRIQ